MFVANTLALEVYEKTRDVLVVQRLLRHRNVESTRVYAQGRLPDVRAAVEA